MSHIRVLKLNLISTFKLPLLELAQKWFRKLLSLFCIRFRNELVPFLEYLFNRRCHGSKNVACVRFIGLLAFACNAKSTRKKLSNCHSCRIFSCFSFLSLFLDGLPKDFLLTFHYSLPKKRVTKIGFNSLVTLKKACVKICWISCFSQGL